MSSFDLKKMATAIDDLTTALDIMLCLKEEDGQEIFESCKNLDILVSSFDDQMNVLKEILLKNKKHFQSKFQSLMEELKTTEKRCDHMIINFPSNSSNIIMGNQSNNVSNLSSNMTSSVHNYKSDKNSAFKIDVNCTTMSNRTMTSNNTISSTKSLSFRATKQVPLIKFVDNNEMEAVPKYMKGCLTSLKVNALIDCINVALKIKYDILPKSKSSLKQKEVDMYNTWKKQQYSVGSGRFFVTADDIARLGETNVNKATLNMVPILRHLKRLKEYRIDGVIYYLPY